MGRGSKKAEAPDPAAVTGVWAVALALETVWGEVLLEELLVRLSAPTHYPPRQIAALRGILTDMIADVGGAVTWTPEEQAAVRRLLGQPTAESATGTAH